MSKTDNLYRNIAAVAGVGTAMTFLGHGMWAVVEKSPKFVQLLTGSYENIFGSTLSDATATNWVQFIGKIDITLAIIFALATVGLLMSGGRLKSLSTSRLLVGLYAWGVFWGFATALSRVTAADTWYPEIWDWVERAPNFALPLIGLIIVLQLRKERQKS